VTSRLILLGTGVPTPNLQRGSASSGIILGDEVILVDCGHGTVHSLIKAGEDPLRIRNVFFTHHHFDHDVDFPYFMLTGWIMGRSKPVEVYGPKGTVEFTESIFKTFNIDISCRLETGIQTKDGLDIRAHDIDEDFSIGGEKWRVTCKRVEHLKQLGNFTLGYRFDMNDGSSVAFSGDTLPCDAVVELARDVDVLVHECFFSPEFEETGLVQDRKKKHPKLPFIHTGAKEVGAIARRAGAKKLVLTHLWSEKKLDELERRVRSEYDGKILIGYDGMALNLR